jgi:hypothetical protein
LAERLEIALSGAMNGNEHDASAVAKASNDQFARIKPVDRASNDKNQGAPRGLSEMRARYLSLPRCSIQTLGFGKQGSGGFRPEAVTQQPQAITHALVGALPRATVIIRYQSALARRRCTAVADRSAPTGAVLHRCGDSSAVEGAFSTPLAFRCRGANRRKTPNDLDFSLSKGKRKQWVRCVEANPRFRRSGFSRDRISRTARHPGRG